ncbi:hypothetical protein HDU89_008949 [Geranomyces variabilis]|nr:hypothetical protein HDU89_008949 [Geranomyces variabilis]
MTISFRQVVRLNYLGVRFKELDRNVDRPGLSKEEVAAAKMVKAKIRALIKAGPRDNKHWHRALQMMGFIVALGFSAIYILAALAAPFPGAAGIGSRL